MKKISCLFLTLTLIIITSIGASAEGSITKESTHNKHYATEQEKQAEFNKQLQDINLHNKIDLRGNGYVYKSEYLEPQYATIEGFIGGQSDTGIRLKSGGSIYYSKSGGPSISVSVGLPKPFDFLYVGVSADIGSLSSGNIGVSLTVPDTIHHFKIYCERVYKVTPIITYRKSRSSLSDDDWEYYAHTSFKVLDTEDYWLVQMD